MLAPRKALWSTPDSAIDAAIEWWWNNRCREGAGEGGEEEDQQQQRREEGKERARQGDDGDGDGDDPPSAPRDVACDVGCGDGRVVLRWAEFLTERGREAGEAEARRRPPFLPPRLVGIDVDPERIQEARGELERLRLERRVGERIEVEFWCGNALDLLPSIAHRVEVCFLYLVPRGLRRIKPILLEPRQLSSSSDPSASTRPPPMLRVITYVSPLEGEAPVRVERVKVPHQPGASWPLYLYEFPRAAAAAAEAAAPTNASNAATARDLLTVR
jgi:SAM-dependent methyltransferase